MGLALYPGEISGGVLGDRGVKHFGLTQLLILLKFLAQAEEITEKDLGVFFVGQVLEDGGGGAGKRSEILLQKTPDFSQDLGVGEGMPAPLSGAQGCSSSVGALPCVGSKCHDLPV